MPDFHDMLCCEGCNTHYLPEPGHPAPLCKRCRISRNLDFENRSTQPLQESCHARGSIVDKEV